MVPIDFENNPWKSTYPLIAAQEAASPYLGNRSLYRAIIALSGLHLANIKGPELGKYDMVTALHYHGLALGEIRESLSHPLKNSNNTVLAAMIVITLAENCFQGTGREWRTHLGSALRYNIHDLSLELSNQGHDTWVMTQTLAMFAIIAQTSRGHSKSSSGFLTNILEGLQNIMAHPCFGYTIGGNSRLLNAILQVRSLEEQMAMTKTVKDTEANILVHHEVEIIMRELNIDACNDEVDIFLSGGLPTDNTNGSPEKRSQVKMHFDLLAASILIYCQRNILDVQPSAVISHVHKVLTYANTFMESHRGVVFIWSVFIAAAEAYTPETQALASRIFDRAEKRSEANRKAMHRIIRQVWVDRQRIAFEWCCDPGEVPVDWRVVMESLNIDILLL